MNEKQSLGAARTPGGQDIEIFDFLSHPTMHLMFNEAYLRLVRAAFPPDRITFHARAGHIQQLKPRLTDVAGIEFRPVAPFEVPFGLSRHNPVAGRWAARRCVKRMRKAILGRTLSFSAVLGVDANLYSVLASTWPSVSRAPLHMILHSHLGDAMTWRSRNPFIRAGDFIAQLQKRLPPNVRLIALELGVKEAIADLSSAAALSVDTLEHPMLGNEWNCDPRPPSDRKLRIAYLGHASRTKGFHIFVELAKRCHRPDLEFEAIGISAPDTRDLDISALKRGPVSSGLPRQDYLAAIRNIDLVCLPMITPAYDFIASGTVADAVAALKPLIAFRTRTLGALADRYGPIGYLVKSEQELFECVQNLDFDEIVEKSQVWTKNLAKIRNERQPQSLALGYRSLIVGIERIVEVDASAHRADSG